MMKAEKRHKTVQVLRTFKFNKIDRVCFQVKSSKGEDIYHTCFDRGHASCTCPAYGECYHIVQLRPRYEAIKVQLEVREAARRDQERAAYVASFNPCMVD